MAAMHLCFSMFSKKQIHILSLYDLTQFAFSKTCLRFYCSKDRTIRSGKLHVRDVDIHYEQTGQGDHSVLLLPGALGSSRTDFSPQLTGLSPEKYNIIAFDPRGYGKSRPPDRDWPSLFYQRDADDAAALMKALGIPRYSILGWSDGGITGLILAGSNPGNVLRLLIWGAKAYFYEEEIKIYKALENIDTWSPKMRQPFIDLYGEDYFRKQWKAWIQAIEVYYSQRKGNLCLSSLPKIKCPTLIMNGLKDPMVSQEHPTFLQKNIANCRTIEWSEGKHNFHLRDHGKFNELAEDFLDEELPQAV